MAASFLCNIGSDLFGTKRNIKLEFPQCPTMAELINAVESQYDVEMRSCRPAGYPDVPFKVQTFQLYDDVLQRWVDLYSSAQLTSGCTVYCFQPESIWHSDAQGIIPSAKDSVTWTTPTGSPRRARIATDAGIAPTLSEKLRSVFYDADAGNKGYVLYSDLKSAFTKCDIEFTYATVGELFTAADANKSGHITYDEWVSFAIKYPAIIDALFFRSRDVQVDQSKQADAAAQQARQQELRAMYERQQAAAAAPPPPPSADVQAAEAALNAQKAQSTAAAQRQAQLQDEFDGATRNAADAERRLLELRAQLDQQKAAAVREQQAAVDTQAALEAQQRALQAEAAKQAEMQARLEQLKKQEAEQQAAAAAAQAAAQQAAAQQAAAAEEARKAAEQRALEMQAAEAARMAAEREQEAQRTAEYEKARKEADEARMAKELAEQREREAWDKMYYQPNSPPRQF